MRRGFRLLLVLVAALGACAAPPTFEQIAPSLPPLPPDGARIFVYRDYETYQSLAWAPVFFNGVRIGAVGPGYVMMRNVPAGTYDIAAASQGLYPNQDKVVVAAPGQTFYAKIETLRGLDPTADRPVPLITFVVVLVDPETARREIAHLWYTADTKGLAASGQALREAGAAAEIEPNWKVLSLCEANCPTGEVRVSGSTPWKFDTCIPSACGHL